MLIEWDNQHFYDIVMEMYLDKIYIEDDGTKKEVKNVRKIRTS